MNTIKIQIIGTVGSGKTTLMSLIAETLEEHGIKFEKNDIDEDDTLFAGNLLEENILSLKDKTIVQLETVQEKRKII